MAIIYYIEGRRADVDRLFEQMVAANPHPFGERAAAARWRNRQGAEAR